MTEIWNKLYLWASRGATAPAPGYDTPEEKDAINLIKSAASFHSDKVEDILIEVSKSLHSAPSSPSDKDVIPVAKVVEVLKEIKAIAERVE